MQEQKKGIFVQVNIDESAYQNSLARLREVAREQARMFSRACLEGLRSHPQGGS